MTQRQIELLMEGIIYHQLHLQKLYEQQTDFHSKQLIEHQHLELCEITKLLIKELDKFE